GGSPRRGPDRPDRRTGDPVPARAWPPPRESRRARPTVRRYRGVPAVRAPERRRPAGSPRSTRNRSGTGSGMSADQEFAPDWCLHPGELLARLLEERGLRQSELAGRTGLSAKHVNQIVKHQIGISPDIAFKLERTLGTPATFWIRAELSYQAFEGRRRA